MFGEHHLVGVDKVNVHSLLWDFQMDLPAEYTVARFGGKGKHILQVTFGCSPRHRWKGHCMPVVCFVGCSCASLERPHVNTRCRQQLHIQ